MRTVRKIIVMFVLAALLAGAMPSFAYAGKNDPVKFTVNNTLFVMQGASSYVDVEATAAEGTSYRLVLECEERGIVLDGASSGVLTGDAKHTFSYTVSRGTETGYKTLVLKAVDASDAQKVLGEQNVFVDVVQNINSFSSLGEAAINVDYAITGSDSLTAGGVNFLKLTLFNRGNTPIFNAKVEIEMPQGFTIQSGPVSRNIGAFEVGQSISVDYPILVDSDMVTGSYPIAVRVSGVRGEEKKEASEAIYIPLVGKDKQDKDDSVPLLIVDSFDFGGGVLKRGADFNLKLTFLNTGSKDMTKVVVNVADASGAVLPKDTSFIKIDSIKSGERVTRSIALRTVSDPDSTQTRLSVDMNYYYEPDSLQASSSYPITLSIEKKPEEGKEGVTNPILMVTNYTLGSQKYAMAGKEFPLNLTITNTSSKTLRNIKVVVQDANGAILPSQGSSSFFIKSIAAGASYGKSLPMAVNNNATPGNDTVVVNMSYEDLNGNTYTSSDTIAIPIMQEDRLVIDEILDPGYLMAGEQAYLQIKYYNMGQTTLNNLRISVSGDFTVDGDASQYIGNMSSGRSDYFSVNFFPEEEGTCNGKAVFTYEDMQGKEQVIEKPFTFNVQPAPNYEDFGGMEEPDIPQKSGAPIWVKLLIPAGVIAGIIVGISVLKRRKRRKMEALDLDE